VFVTDRLKGRILHSRRKGKRKRSKEKVAEGGDGRIGPDILRGGRFIVKKIGWALHEGRDKRSFFIGGGGKETYRVKGTIRVSGEKAFEAFLK